MTESVSVKRRRWWIPAAWIVSVVVAGAIGWFAAEQAVTPERLESTEVEAVTVEVVEDTVRQEQSYVVHASWQGAPGGVNGYTGTLTSVNVTGTTVEPGDEIYSVDLEPVFAMEGDVPAFRSLSRNDSGEDVEQLQQFLMDTDYLWGEEPTGTYDGATAEAVRAWSADNGLGNTTEVPRGRVVFLPELPAAIGLDAEVAVGNEVTPGQVLITVVSAEPRFSLPVLQDAAARIQPGMRVEIVVADDIWQAEVDEIVSAEDGSLEALLVPPEDATSICGDQCGELVDVGDSTQLQGTLILVPETSGPAVPTAAVRVDATGSTSVMLEDGRVLPVTVLASSNGQSVVEGVEPGQRVLVREQPEG